MSALFHFQKRKAYHFPYCLSTKTVPTVVNFDAASLLGGIITNGKRPGIDKCGWCPPYERKTIETQCFPLYSILQALGNPTVHYFSLDVEGSEIQILKTIPFDKVDIKVIDVEFKNLGDIFPGTLQELDDLLLKNGYEYNVETKDPYGRPNDKIYVKKGFIEELDRVSNSKRDKSSQQLHESDSNSCSRPLSLLNEYEAETVEVQTSTIKNSGEGLFAFRDIKKGEVISFYSGYPNTGNLQKVLDFDYYEGTLGHKANNNFSPYINAVLDEIDIPRFGSKKTISATRDISKGEEIFYDYGYDPYAVETKKYAPWYVKQFKYRTIVKYIVK